MRCILPPVHPNPTLSTLGMLLDPPQGPSRLWRCGSGAGWVAQGSWAPALCQTSLCDYDSMILALKVRFRGNKSEGRAGEKGGANCWRAPSPHLMLFTALIFFAPCFPSSGLACTCKTLQLVDQIVKRGLLVLQSPSSFTSVSMNQQRTLAWFTSQRKCCHQYRRGRSQTTRPPQESAVLHDINGMSVVTTVESCVMLVVSEEAG